MPKTIYRALVGTFTVFAVGMQYWLVVWAGSGTARIVPSIRFFSYFTHLTNMAAAAALLLPLVAPRTAAGAFLARPMVRTAIAGYVIMVCGVYYVLLAGIGNPRGWQLVFEHVLHTATPALFVLDWLLFVDKRGVGRRVGLQGLWYPLAYIAWILTRGAETDWYPYPFLDVRQFGYERVLVTVGELTMVFVVIELMLVWVGRRIGHLGERAAPETISPRSSPQACR